MDWFRSYLNDRTQTTQIGNSYISKKAIITTGVPQGSVLGPLLFCSVLMILRIVQRSLNFFFLLMTQIYSTKTLKSLEKIVSEELCHLYDWLSSNKL